MIAEISRILLIALFILISCWAIIDHYFPDYRNYIIGLWQFYVLKKFDKPIHFRIYEDLNRQLVRLQASGSRKYEQRLVKMILDHCGKYKAKMTGKHKTKVRWKIYRHNMKITNKRSSLRGR